MKNKIFVTISFVLFAFCFAVFYVGLQKPNIYTPKLDKQIELPNFGGNDFFSIFLLLSHPKLGPSDIKIKKGIKKGIISLLKNGGPTEILWFDITSRKIG